MTTLQRIIQKIRTAEIVDSEKVNYGFTDNLEPPYVCVMDFQQTPDYNTGGVAVLYSDFDVICIGRNCDEAETTSAAVDSALNLSKTIAPNSTCWLQSYTVGQMAENLYQFGAVRNYKLEEGF